MYSDEKPMKTKYAVVKNGVEENIEVERGEKFTYLDVKGKDMKKIKKIEKINCSLIFFVLCHRKNVF